MTEGTVCARCGAVYARKTWRHDHHLTEAQIDARLFSFCPACLQVARSEGQGRVVINGFESRSRVLGEIAARVRNVAAAAMRTQPERRIVSIDRTNGGRGLEVITTSQKLAHRIAHEIKKAFGGRATYAWSDDGTLWASVRFEKRK